MSDAEAMSTFSVSMGNKIKQHKRALKHELKSLGGNEKVRQYLEKSLISAVDAFYRKVSQQLTGFNEDTLNEGRQSQWRLKEIVDSFKKDLKGEIKQEKQELRDEEFLESSDHQWKLMAEKYKQKGHTETQDEKDEEEMLNNFEENLELAKEVKLSKSDFQEAQQLQELGTKLLEIKDDPDNKRRPRNQVRRGAGQLAYVVFALCVRWTALMPMGHTHAGGNS